MGAGSRFVPVPSAGWRPGPGQRAREMMERERGNNGKQGGQESEDWGDARGERLRERRQRTF